MLGGDTRVAEPKLGPPILRAITKNNQASQKVFDSHRVMLYNGSGTSIVLGNPKQGSDRFKGNTRRWPGLLPDWQYNQ
jgi:hypothetical protein